MAKKLRVLTERGREERVVLELGLEIRSVEQERARDPVAELRARPGARKLEQPFGLGLMLARRELHARRCAGIGFGDFGLKRRESPRRARALKGVLLTVCVRARP